MVFRKRRENLRAILSGSACIRPGSVYDAISIRIAADLGFEVGMFGGSVASLAVLGDPDRMARKFSRRLWKVIVCSGKFED